MNTSITPEYFKNEMNEYELKYVIQEINKKYKEDWEIIRFNNYSISKIMTGSPDKPTDFMIFDWDLTNRTEINIDKIKEQMNDGLSMFNKIKDKI